MSLLWLGTYTEPVRKKLFLFCAHFLPLMGAPNGKMTAPSSYAYKIRHAGLSTHPVRVLSLSLSLSPPWFSPDFLERRNSCAALLEPFTDKLLCSYWFGDIFGSAISLKFGFFVPFSLIFCDWVGLGVWDYLLDLWNLEPVGEILRFCAWWLVKVVSLQEKTGSGVCSTEVRDFLLMYIVERGSDTI